MTQNVAKCSKCGDWFELNTAINVCCDNCLFGGIPIRDIRGNNLQNIREKVLQLTCEERLVLFEEYCDICGKYIGQLTCNCWR